MTESSLKELEPRERRRLIAVALLRALLTSAVLVALYYTLPLEGMVGLSSWLRVAVGLTVFAIVVAWQIQTVVRASYPGIRAIEALASTVPLFLLVFATTYFLLSANHAGSFSQENLSRTDSLYFVVTVFSTVGFGDISATSQSARLVVTSQMILDLVVLGLGINAFVSAAKLGRQRQSANGATED